MSAAAAIADRRLVQCVIGRTISGNDQVHRHRLHARLATGLLIYHLGEGAELARLRAENTELAEEPGILTPRPVRPAILDPGDLSYDESANARADPEAARPALGPKRMIETGVNKRPAVVIHAIIENVEGDWRCFVDAITATQ